MSINYKEKYLKYKTKFLNLEGGKCPDVFSIYIYNAQNMEKYLFNIINGKESILSLVLKCIDIKFIINIVLYDPFNKVEKKKIIIDNREIKLIYTNKPFNRDVIKLWKPFLILDFNSLPCDKDHDGTNSIYFEPIYNDEQYTTLPIFDRPLFTIDNDKIINIPENNKQIQINSYKNIVFKYGIDSLYEWAHKHIVTYYTTHDGIIYIYDNNYSLYDISKKEELINPFLCFNCNIEGLINPYSNNQNITSPKYDVEKNGYNIYLENYNNIISYTYIRNRFLFLSKVEAKRFWQKKNVNNAEKFNKATEDIYKIIRAVQDNNSDLLYFLLINVFENNSKNNTTNLNVFNNYISNIPYHTLNKLLIYSQNRLEKLYKNNNISLIKCIKLLKITEAVKRLLGERQLIRKGIFPNIFLSESKIINNNFNNELKIKLRYIVQAVNATIPIEYTYSNIENEIFKLVLKYYK